MANGGASGGERAESGLAHVATVSFLAARVAPAGGFWIALAGGVALARAGERRGLRHGYGTSLAAMLQTVAVLGPARVGIPLTQALTAPLIGHLRARKSRLASQLLVCAALRLVHTAAATAVFIWVIAGGPTPYARTYSAVVRHVPLLPGGTTGALVLTAASLLAWAAFASTVQVLLYLRGLRRWPSNPDRAGGQHEPATAAPSLAQPHASGQCTFDPRAVALAAIVAFALLLVSTSWPL